MEYKSHAEAKQEEKGCRTEQETEKEAYEERWLCGKKQRETNVTAKGC